ncbi:MAG: alpha/beta fold hydrolase [Terriglobia bacterium]
MDPAGHKFLHQPKETAAVGGVVLTHGAGANCHAPLLITVAEALCAHGFYVLRYDLPFRRQRPKGPPHPSGAEADRAGLAEAVAGMREIVQGPVFLGGHSYGGRQASMLAAAQPDLVAGLLLLSYPLHPPGKPEQPRTAHFPELRTPALFVHGAKDEFGTEAEMKAALAMIPASTALMMIAGAGHDLKHGKFDLAAMIASFTSPSFVSHGFTSRS